MSIYVPSNHIISELRCHGNLSTSSKTAPLCLRQVLVVRTSLIQISDTRTSVLTILRFLCVIFFIICHDFNPSVWHTQRMRKFVTIFLWRFFAPVWHSLYRDLLKVVRERKQSLLCSCYHTFSKSLLGSVKGVRLEPI